MEEVQKYILKQEVSYERNLKRNPSIAQQAKKKLDMAKDEIKILEKEKNELVTRLELKSDNKQKLKIF